MNDNSEQCKSIYHSRAIAKAKNKPHASITKVIRELISEDLLISTIETTYQCSQSKRIYPAYWCCYSDLTLITLRLAPKTKPVKSSYKRKDIDHEVRRFVYERDAYRCKGCEDWHDLCIDHVLPVSRGGSNNTDNLQTLCRSCNSKKGAKTMDEWLTKSSNTNS